MTVVWSIDPGAVHVGRAIWVDGAATEAEELTPNGLLSQLTSPPWEGKLPHIVVVESFNLTPRFGRSRGSDAVETIELIGKIKGICLLREIPVVTQTPAVRGVAMKGRAWRDLIYGDNPIAAANDHIRSALAHGLYFYKFGKGRTA